ncbi:MAG: ABC transporter ATP-binding protein [Nitrososphaerales archaeon]
MAAISVSELRKSYGAIKAVDGLSFFVDSGKIFSMLGPNGAGKTTTIEILEGLRPRDSGDVQVLGVDPWKDGYALHKKIGVIPQGFRFFDKATPKEAINYYADLFGVKADAKSILHSVILEDAANVYFENLSGGQKQKVGLALSLVNDPELLFLDEPTTGLDPQARRAVWEVIRNLKRQGRTVLLTTHYLEEAEQLADEIVIVNKGKIIAEGSPLEIIANYGSGERLSVRGSQALADYLRSHTRLVVQYDGSGYVSITIRNKNDALEAIGAIEQSGMDWSDLSTERESLEDIFVKLVGTPIDDEGLTVGAKVQDGKQS